MALEGGGVCAKYLLFFFNLLFVLSGLIILGFGILCESSYSHYTDFIKQPYISLPIILIVVGLIIFVTAFLGCCGAFAENHCMVVTFSLCLIVIFLLEVAAGIGGYVMHNQLDTIMDKKINETFANYYNDHNLQKIVNMTQYELECCGVNGPSDWATYGEPIPLTCCSAVQVISGQPARCAIDSANLYRDGCKTKLINFFQTKSVLIGGVGLGIAGIQLLGMIYACILARSIRQQYESV